MEMGAGLTATGALGAGIGLAGGLTDDGLVSLAERDFVGTGLLFSTGFGAGLETLAGEPFAADDLLGVDGFLLGTMVSQAPRWPVGGESS